MRPTRTRAGSVKNRHREKTTRQPSSILIVGSGFAGLECARRLSRLLQRHRSDATVTLISPVDHLLYTPLLPEVAGGAIDPRFATVPLIDILPGVLLFRAYVDSVDLSARSLHCRDQENTSHELSWGVFVYSSGVRPLFDVHTTKESDMTTHKTGPTTASSEGTVTVTETGSGTYTQQITAGHHRLVADEPRPIGDDAGPTPYDLLLAALGACTSMTVRMYAARKGWPLERVRVTLRHSRIHAKDCVECETTSGWIHHIDRDIELDGDLDDAQRQRLFHIAERCPIHQTLTSEVNIATSLQ